MTRLHRNCISDPLAKELWRDYQHVVSDGNPLGLSYVEYVTARIVAQRSVTVTAANNVATDYRMAQCGHKHPWGESCSAWTDV